MLPSKDRLPKITRQGTNRCFGCGLENPIGLRLTFEHVDDRVVTEFTSTEFHQGWPGYVHGGILFTLLDEVMGYTFYPEGLDGVTAKAEVRYRSPAPIGETLIVEGTVSKKTKRLIESRATITLRDGTVVAEGKALMYILGKAKEMQT